MTAQTAAPPCPEWCHSARTLDGHESGWEGGHMFDGRPWRGHSMKGATVYSAEAAFVEICIGATEIEGEPVPVPDIEISTGRPSPRMTTAEARHVATAILDACERIDEIAGAAR